MHQVRPPKLLPPPLPPPPELPGEDDDPDAPELDLGGDHVEAESDIQSGWAGGGGIRAKPPRLLPFDTHQAHVNLLGQELKLLAQVGLDARTKELHDGFDGGGGIKVRPPFLKPVKLSPMDAKREEEGRKRDHDANVIEEAARLTNDGGGVRVRPPKLLAALVTAARPDGGDDLSDLALPLSENHPAFLEQDAFALRGIADDAGTAGAGPRLNGDAFASRETTSTDAEHLALLEIALSAQTRTLEKGWHGYGGVRLPPPKLKAPPEDAGVFPDQCEAPTTALGSDWTGKAAGHKQSEYGSDEVMTLEDDVIVVNGGGCRVKPPKLRPLDGWSTIDVQEEIDWREQLGAAPMTHNELMRFAKQGLIGLEEDATPIGLRETEEELFGPTALTEALVISEGGGCRVKPPKLMPMGGWTPLEVKADVEWREQMGVPVTQEELLQLAKQILPDTDSDKNVDVTGSMKASHAMEHPLEVSVGAILGGAAEYTKQLDEVAVAEAGGGVRVKPPKLCSIGNQSKNDAQAELDFAIEVGAMAYKQEDPRALEMTEHIARIPTSITYPAGDIELTERQLLAVTAGQMTYIEAEMEALMSSPQLEQTKRQKKPLLMDLQACAEPTSIMSASSAAPMLMPATPTKDVVSGDAPSIWGKLRGQQVPEAASNHTNHHDARQPGGYDGGGGARIVPPPLHPCGKQTGLMLADEAEFRAEMGAAPLTAEEIIAASGRTQDDAIDGTAASDSTAPMKQAMPAALCNEEVEDGLAAGGGVRLPPPRLLPVATTSTKTIADRQEEEKYNNEFGPPPADLEVPSMFAHESEFQHLKGDQESLTRGLSRRIESPLPLSAPITDHASHADTTEETGLPSQALTRTSTIEEISNPLFKDSASGAQGLQRTRELKHRESHSEFQVQSPTIERSVPEPPVTIAKALVPRRVLRGESGLEEGFDGGGGLQIMPPLLEIRKRAEHMGDGARRRAAAAKDKVEVVASPPPSPPSSPRIALEAPMLLGASTSPLSPSRRSSPSLHGNVDSNLPPRSMPSLREGSVVHRGILAARSPSSLSVRGDGGLDGGFLSLQSPSSRAAERGAGRNMVRNPVRVAPRLDTEVPRALRTYQARDALQEPLRRRTLQQMGNTSALPASRQAYGEAAPPVIKSCAISSELAEAIANDSAMRTEAEAEVVDDLLLGQEDDPNARPGEVPSAMPERLLKTLMAEARRRQQCESGTPDVGLDSALSFAMQLVKTYTAAWAHSETWGRATKYGQQQKVRAVAAMGATRGNGMMATAAGEGTQGDSPSLGGMMHATDAMAEKADLKLAQELEEKEKLYLATILTTAMAGVNADVRVIRAFEMRGSSGDDVTSTAQEQQAVLLAIVEVTSKIEALEKLQAQRQQGFLCSPVLCCRRRKVQRAKPTQVAPAAPYEAVPDRGLAPVSTHAHASWRATSRTSKVAPADTDTESAVQHPPSRLLVGLFEDRDEEQGGGM